MSLSRSIIGQIIDRVNKEGGTMMYNDDWGDYGDFFSGDSAIETKEGTKTGASKQTTGSTYNYQSCDHVREAFPVDKTHFVYLSSSRGYNWKPSKEQLDRHVDFGVYLDASWKRELEPRSYASLVNNLPKGAELPKNFIADWEGKIQQAIPGIYLPWADRGAPPVAQVSKLLEYINKSIQAGFAIEIACLGGHGRTGTLAAAVLLSRNKTLKAKEAIDLVRKVYCQKAIESVTQEKLLYDLTGEVMPTPPPSKASTYSNYNNKGNHNPLEITKDEIKTLKNVYFNSDPSERLALKWNDLWRKEEVVYSSQQDNDGKFVTVWIPKYYYKD